jgi:formate dehydrogenase iron-sulfur subunit
MVSLASNGWPRSRKKHEKAQLVDADDVNVIYLVSEAPADYHEFVMAAAGAHGVTRQMAMRKMVRPFARAFRQLA